MAHAELGSKEEASLLGLYRQTLSMGVNRELGPHVFDQLMVEPMLTLVLIRKQLIGVAKEVHNNVRASAVVVVRMLRKKLGDDGDGWSDHVGHGRIGTVRKGHS